MKAISQVQIQLIHLASIFLAGVLAGVFFTWTNAITPGIGNLDDLSYLSSFQAMNRKILNPLFYVTFIGPLFLMPISWYLHKLSWVKKRIVVAFIIYFFGVFIITMIGNIPLNEMLDGVILSELGDTQLAQIRLSFEYPWNQFHLIRAIASSLSFFFLLLSIKMDNLFTKNTEL